MTAMDQQATSPTDPTADAAVLVMLLEEAEAAAILSQLSPGELGLLGERMCELGNVAPDAINTAIAGFLDRTESLGLVDTDRLGRVHSLMARAVGEVKADNLMQRIAPGAAAPNALEIVRWLTPESLMPLIVGEHPQAIAVLLLQIDPQIAAQVLHSLPEETQPEVVRRVASLGPLRPEAMEMLEEILNRRIAECHGKGMLQMGGPREAAEIINSAGKAAGARIMPAIAKADKALARRIEEEMFTFEHLYALGPQDMGALLREVDSDTLIDALKGIAEDRRDLFFAAMSSRAADGVRDEIATRGRMKSSDVEAAQRVMVTVARRLAADGTISFGSDDDEFV
jgi:flagellar motor switch protein FliG